MIVDKLKQYPDAKLKSSYVKVTSKSLLLRYLNEVIISKPTTETGLDIAINHLVKEGFCERVGSDNSLIRFLKVEPYKHQEPAPALVKAIDNNLAKYAPKKKAAWSASIEEYVREAVLNGTTLDDIRAGLKLNFSFVIGARYLGARIGLMRQRGVLPLTGRNRAKFHWRDEEAAELIRLKGMGYTFVEIADILAKKFNRPITYSAVATKYRDITVYKRNLNQSCGFDNFKSVGSIAQNIVAGLAVPND